MFKHCCIIFVVFGCAIGAKLNSTDVSVLDYGADRTGVNDTSIAFNSALQYALINGVNVYVPNGVYIHDNIIVVNSVLLYGDGYSSQIHGTTIDSAAIKLIGTNVGISDLRITALSHSRMTAPWNDNVWCADATNFTINNIVLEPNSTYAQNSDYTIFGVGGMIMLNCSYGTISNNQVHWTWADAIHNTDKSNNLLIINNTIHNPGDDSIAVVSYGGDSICHDIIITKNTIYNTTNRGITVIGGTRIKIVENSLSKMVGGGIWLAGESSYDTANPIDVLVLRNSIVGIDNNCNSGTGPASLPAIGFDSSNGKYGIADNLIFAENYVDSGCRDLFRVSGSYVDKVILIGNRFKKTSHEKMVFFTNANVTVYSAGNQFEDGNTRFYYTANIKNHYATNEIFSNLTASSLGAICYQYDTVPVNIQISNPTNDSTIKTFLHLGQVSGEFYASDTPNVPVSNTGAVPPVAFNFSLTIQSPAKIGAEFKVSETIFQKYVSVNRTVSLIGVYGGDGGVVETSIDRKIASFQVTNIQSDYYFKYVIAGSDFGISEATVHVTFTEDPSTTSAVTGNSTDSPINKSSRMTIGVLSFVVCAIFIIF